MFDNKILKKHKSLKNSNTKSQDQAEFMIKISHSKKLSLNKKSSKNLQLKLNQIEELSESERPTLSYFDKVLNAERTPSLDLSKDLVSHYVPTAN